MPAVENTELENHVTLLGERAAAGTQIEIADVQIRGAGKNRLVRIYIDKPGGITHGDCELISERISQFLDDEDAIPGDSYTLEVSSPGVERKLSKPRDFERVVGKNVKLTTLEPFAGRTSLVGKLENVTGEGLDLEISPGSRVHIPLAQVRKANLKFDW